MPSLSWLKVDFCPPFWRIKIYREFGENARDNPRRKKKEREKRVCMNGESERASEPRLVFHHHHHPLFFLSFLFFHKGPSRRACQYPIFKWRAEDPISSSLAPPSPPPFMHETVLVPARSHHLVLKDDAQTKVGKEKGYFGSTLLVALIITLDSKKKPRSRGTTFGGRGEGHRAPLQCNLLQFGRLWGLCSLSLSLSNGQVNLIFHRRRDLHYPT